MQRSSRMASQVERIAKKWLNDPDWAAVYKLNVDNVEDSMNMLLISIGDVLLTLKITMSFGSGDITCILTGKFLHFTYIRTSYDQLLSFLRLWIF